MGSRHRRGTQIPSCRRETPVRHRPGRPRHYPARHAPRRTSTRPGTSERPSVRNCDRYPSRPCHRQMSPSRVRPEPPPRSAHGSWMTHVHPEVLHVSWRLCRELGEIRQSVGKAHSVAPAATWFCPPTTNRRCPEDTQATRLRNVVSARISDTRYPTIRAGFIVHPEAGAAGAYLADLAGRTR